VTLDGEALFDSENGQWVAPQDRRVGFVFQDLALFPHLSVIKTSVRLSHLAKGAERARRRVRRPLH